MSNILKEYFHELFKKKPKLKLDSLGFYDTKPFDSYISNLKYAEETLIEETNGISVFYRIFKNSLFLVTIVEDELEFSLNNYSTEKITSRNKDKIKEGYTSVINVIIFKNNNEQTVTFAKEKAYITKKEFNQVLIYNSKHVGLEYYRPVPTYSPLYPIYAELIYFDLGAIEIND